MQITEPLCYDSSKKNLLLEALQDKDLLEIVLDVTAGTLLTGVTPCLLSEAA